MSDTKKTKLELLKEEHEALQEKIKKNKAKQQLILNREKEKERKARTRKLIQKGAIIENYLGEKFNVVIDTAEDLSNFLKENDDCFILAINKFKEKKMKEIDNFNLKKEPHDN